MIDVNLSLAFATGMVATVNPCGFAMLPAYLSFFLGIEDERASLPRAMVVGAAVTAGFAATFAVVGLVVNWMTTSVYDVAPWISLVIGAVLALLGVALVSGFDLAVRLPRLDRGGRNRDLGSMALFGVSYAVASIGCELPLFLAAITGVFGKNLASGVVYFVVFAVGFAAVITSLTVALAMARQSLLHTMRRVLPYVNRIAGALLVLTGAYVAWYGWIEIRSAKDDATVGRVTDWSFTVGDFLQDNQDVVLALFVAAVVGGVLMAFLGRRRGADVR